MSIWKALMIDGLIICIEETNDEHDIQQYKSRRRQKTIYKDNKTITNLLIEAETEKEARTKAYDRWSGVLSRGKVFFQT